MNTTCLEYFVCFDYRRRGNQLHIRHLEGHELQKLLSRRRLEAISDQYVRRTLIDFIRLELIKRGCYGGAGLIGAVEDEGPASDVRVYTNSETILVAVKTFVTVPCFIED